MKGQRWEIRAIIKTVNGLLEVIMGAVSNNGKYLYKHERGRTKVFDKYWRRLKLIGNFLIWNFVGWCFYLTGRYCVCDQ